MKHKISFLCVCLVATSSVCAYELQTHADISQKALSASALNQPTAGVLTDLGLPESIDIAQQFVNSKGNPRSISELIGDGAKFEDDNIRPFNHFYNPLTNAPLTVGGIVWGRTSPDWALEDNGQITSVLGIGEQNFSLGDARGYLYRALTETTETDRKRNFGLLFQTLGQVIHHVQDMAQPQHVRNDPHLVSPFTNPSLYELWTDKDDIRRSLPFSGYAPTYSALDGSTFNVPRKVWHTPDGKGIADFTNRNFVSAGTNFDKPGVFPSPALDETKKMDMDIQRLCTNANPPCPNPNLKGVITFYGALVDDKYTGETPLNNPFASSFSIFNADLNDYNGTPLGEPRLFTLNRFNFALAHIFLIPRAVGYSAGLINYFFRGKIDMVPDPTDASRLLVKNLGAEPMSGKFSLYYDDKSGVRHPVPDASGAPIVWDTAVLLASASGKLDAGAGMSVPGFPPPTNPAPKALGEYMLVFQGDMGEEKLDATSNPTGAVVAKQVRNPYQGALYLAGLDNNGNVLSLKVDPGGVTVLSGFDISKADAAHPNGVFVGNFGKFDPLQKVLGAMQFQGFSTVSKGYLMKQAAFDPVTGLHQPLSATFYVPNLPPNQLNFPSYVLSRPAEVQYGQVRWVAKSSDPSLGTFEFAFFGGRDASGNTVLPYTRTFSVNGTPQTVSGALVLPALPPGDSYNQFFNPAEPLLVSDDGTLITGFAQRYLGSETFARTHVRIALGAIPSAVAEVDTFPLEIVNDEPPYTHQAPAGSCSVTVRDQHGKALTVTNQGVDFDRNILNQEAQRIEQTPIAFIGGALATYSTIFKWYYDWHFKLSGCTVWSYDWDGAQFTGQYNLNIASETRYVSQLTTEFKFGGGSYRRDFPETPPVITNTTVNTIPSTAIPPWQGLPLFPLLESGIVYTSFTQNYVGPEPYAPVSLTSTTVGPRDYPLDTIVRPLTGRSRDVIYAESPSENMPAAPKFRDVDLTGVAYVADASPEGEIFFATSDLSTIIHEPKGLSMPVIDRGMLPSNLARLLIAVWL